MVPEAALERQIELYRAMTGEQRVKIALDLHEFACNVSRAGIRHQYPDATPEEVERHLRRRIELSRELGRGAEFPADALSQLREAEIAASQAAPDVK